MNAGARWWSSVRAMACSTRAEGAAFGFESDSFFTEEGRPTRIGQALGVPIYKLLGGAVRNYIPCYTHCGDPERAMVDHDRTYKRIVGYLKKTSPHMVDRVIRHREKTPLFELLEAEAIGVRLTESFAMFCESIWRANLRYPSTARDACRKKSPWLKKPAIRKMLRGSPNTV